MLDRVVLGQTLEADGELRPAHLASSDVGERRQVLAEGPVDFTSVWSSYDGVLSAGTALQWAGPGNGSQLRVSTVEADPNTAILGTVVMRGNFDGGRWWATYGLFSSAASVDFSIEAVDGSFGNTGTVGACGSTSLGRFDGSAGSLLGGVSPAGTTRVTLELDTATTIDAVVQELPDGAVAWGVYIDATEGLVRVSAADGEGAVLERLDASTTDPFPPTNLATGVCPDPEG